MRTYVAKLVAVLMPLVALIPVIAAGQTLDLSDSGRKLDGIAALVNDGVVLTSELNDQTMLIIQRLRAEGTPLPPPEVLQQQILENLIVSQIQLQRAQREGIVISDEMLNRALSDIARRNGTTLTELPELLAASNIRQGPVQHLV